MEAILAMYGAEVKAHRPMSFSIEARDPIEIIEERVKMVEMVKKKYPELGKTNKVVEYSFQPAIITVKIYD